MRISMSLPRGFLNEFDEVLKDRGYQSRSKGIRDALKDYIVRYQWMNEMEGDRIGVLSVVCDYNYTGVLEDLTNIQHDYQQYIKSIMHIQLTEKQILEVIVLKGDVKEIRDLAENIKRLKGVDYVKLTSTTSGKPK